MTPYPGSCGIWSGVVELGRGGKVVVLFGLGSVEDLFELGLEVLISSSGFGGLTEEDAPEGADDPDELSDFIGRGAGVLPGSSWSSTTQIFPARRQRRLHLRHFFHA